MQPQTSSHIRLQCVCAHPDAGRKKLDEKSSEGIFLGYSSDKVGYYYILLLENRKLTRSRDVLFDENHFSFVHEYARMRGLDDEDESDEPPHAANNDASSSASSSHHVMLCSMGWKKIYRIHLTQTMNLIVRRITHHGTQ